MASLVQQTVRSIFFRNFNVLRTIATPKRGFHALSCAPMVHIQQKFQLAQYSSKDVKEIETRVMKVISEYDKLSAAKISLDSHFIQDLGLDSLDHVEVIMALEDEFGFEIPDNEAEKLARPADIVKYVVEKEETAE